MSVRMQQKDAVIGAIAGASLLFHLLSAGNFIPSSEMWFIGTILSYLHSLLNWTVRLSLLSVLVIIGSEHSRPGTLQRFIGINHGSFPQLLFKFMAVAFAASLVRMILPGPVTYYSRFYKLGVILNLAGSIILVLSTGATFTLRRTAFRRPPLSSTTPPREEEDIAPEDVGTRSRRYSSVAVLLK